MCITLLFPRYSAYLSVGLTLQLFCGISLLFCQRAALIKQLSLHKFDLISEGAGGETVSWCYLQRLAQYKILLELPVIQSNPQTRVRFCVFTPVCQKVELQKLEYSPYSISTYCRYIHRWMILWHACEITRFPETDRPVMLR